MASFLDLTTGLPALWAKIKSKFYTKTEVDALIPDNTTYSLSISNNVITLTGSDSSTSSVTLPVYNGGVSS